MEKGSGHSCLVSHCGLEDGGERNRFVEEQEINLIQNLWLCIYHADFGKAFMEAGIDHVRQSLNLRKLILKGTDTTGGVNTRDTYCE